MAHRGSSGFVVYSNKKPRFYAPLMLPYGWKLTYRSDLNKRKILINYQFMNCEHTLHSTYMNDILQLIVHWENPFVSFLPLAFVIILVPLTCLILRKLVWICLFTQYHPTCEIQVWNRLLPKSCQTFVPFNLIFKRRLGVFVWPTFAVCPLKANFWARFQLPEYITQMNFQDTQHASQRSSQVD